MHLFASLMQQLGRKKQPSVAAQKMRAQKKRRLQSIQEKAPTVDLTSDLPAKHARVASGSWKQVGDVKLLEADRYNNIYSLYTCSYYSNSEIYHYVHVPYYHSMTL